MKRRNILKTVLLSTLICTMAAFGADHVVVKGNPKSKVYHKAGCHHYAAKGSSAEFKSEPEAVKAGYIACKQCGKAKEEKKAAGEKK
ncbi:MAG TPA: hypothetical protein VIR77_04420 [Pontiella sp.]